MTAGEYKFEAILNNLPLLLKALGLSSGHRWSDVMSQRGWTQEEAFNAFTFTASTS